MKSAVRSTESADRTARPFQCAVFPVRDSVSAFARLVGMSQALSSATTLLERFSACDLPILIEGETGTGKELAARAVHYASTRRDMPFIPVNCGAIPDALLENELFGHKRGAFTDAKEEQRGLVSLADRGTLFLDEIDGLSTKGQVVLLRFLQDLEYRPVGSPCSLRADIRFVAATNVDLQKAAAQGTFRADVLFRLKILHVVLPPLRHRIEDIRMLSDHFLRTCSERLGIPCKTFHPDIMSRLVAYSWPGNVRELENFIYRAFLVTDGPEIRLDHVAALCFFDADQGCSAVSACANRNFHQAKSRAIAQFEQQYLADLMERACGNVTAAAKLAGTERRYLGKLLKKHNIRSHGSYSGLTLE
jgi:two-component system, NtrC family, response regulator GlrR